MKKSTPNTETRANTRGLISRSLTATTATILVYLKDKKETVQEIYTVQGAASDSDIIKAYNKENVSHIALDVLNKETTTHLYAMDIDTFIANAKIMD